MKSFFVKIILFSIPLCVLFLFPATVLFLGREYFSFKEVVNAQQKNPETLFGFAYNGEPFYMYKNYLVKIENPKVIALGTSRVMQFRKEFFTEDTHFINAGGAGKTIADIDRFVASLPKDGSVKVIILGLDKDALTAPLVIGGDNKEDILPIRFIKLSVMMSRRIYLDYVANKYTVNDIKNAYTSTTNIGISALVHGDGFRSDGSYRYGGAMQNPARLSALSDQINEQVGNISQTQRFFTDDEKNNFEKNVRVLGRVLVKARERGVVVIGFMPPYPTPIYNAMVLHDNSLAHLSAELNNLFTKEGMYFFDISSIETVGGKETEFVDTNHGTDMLYAKIISTLYDKSKAISPYVDIKRLRAALKNTQADFYSE